MNIEVIQTDALDELNDMMAFWYLPDEKIISDDGWTYHEVYEETTQTEELAIKCCERFFCEFYQSEKEFILVIIWQVFCYTQEVPTKRGRLEVW